jgi:hypothetical protein
LKKRRLSWRSRRATLAASMLLCTASAAGVVGSGSIAHAASRGPENIASVQSGATVCLDVMWANIDVGQPVGMWDCKGETQTNQAFTLASDGTLQSVGGYCIEVGSDLKTRLQPCAPGKAEQTWFAEGDPGSDVQLKNGQNCLVAADAGTYPLTLAACDTNRLDEFWDVPDSLPRGHAPKQRPTTAGVNAIVSVGSALCLDAYANQLTPGTIIGTWECGGTSKVNQQFRPKTDGTIRIGLSCLASDPEGRMGLADCDPSSSSQQWTASGPKAGPVQIIGGQTHTCLTAPNVATSQLTLAACRDSSDGSSVANTQLWWVPSDMAVVTDSGTPPAPPAAKQLVNQTNWRIQTASGPREYGRSLEPEDQSSSDGAKIVIWGANPNHAAQRWTAVPATAAVASSR